MLRPGTTVIVGGGASGALTAVHLQRSACPPDRLVVIEPGADLGKGIAYGTTDVSHLLNVRAGNLSALPEEPGHFSAWAQQRTPADPRSFLPRALYGEYLNSLLGPVEHIRARVTDIIAAGTGVRIVLSDGKRVEADRAILAPGSSPSVWPACLGGVSRRWVSNPWAPGALAALRPGDPVLLVGTGLTAVDVALSLGAAGHRIIATSRHGLIPQAHIEQPKDAIGSIPPSRPTARSFLAWARSTAAEVGDWSPVVDSLRIHTNRLWEEMADPECLRLLRHVHRRWEVLRHRMAPQVAARVRELRESGQLTIVAGQIGKTKETMSGIDVAVGDGNLRVSAVVNCSGPTADVTQTSDPLVRCLLDRRVARPGHLGLGLDTDERGCLPDTDCALWLIGPLRRGRLWETTAIPEIRVQAADLAKSVVRAPDLLAV